MKVKINGKNNFKMHILIAYHILLALTVGVKKLLQTNVQKFARDINFKMGQLYAKKLAKYVPEVPL
jgi:hypothetical protein